MLEKISQIIAQHGWAVLSVGPDAEDPIPAGFSYTIGLTAKGLPELCVAGINGRDAGFYLNKVAERVVSGEAMADGFLLPGLLSGGLAFMLRTVPTGIASTRLKAVLARYPGDVSALALVYQDENGLWPWQEGCSEPTKTLGQFWGPLSEPWRH